MKWISIKEELPPPFKIIVAIMNGERGRYGEDPIEDAEIVILRSLRDGQFLSLDYSAAYYLPDEKNPSKEFDYYSTIQYWMLWNEFIFPKSMILDIQKYDCNC